LGAMRVARLRNSFGVLAEHSGMAPRAKAAKSGKDAPPAAARRLRNFPMSRPRYGWVTPRRMA
jgi:hypothetical protein